MQKGPNGGDILTLRTFSHVTNKPIIIFNPATKRDFILYPRLTPYIYVTEEIAVWHEEQHRHVFAAVKQYCFTEKEFHEQYLHEKDYIVWQASYRDPITKQWIVPKDYAKGSLFCDGPSPAKKINPLQHV
jgi:hypothetical protein